MVVRGCGGGGEGGGGDGVGSDAPNARAPIKSAGPVRTTCYMVRHWVVSIRDLRWDIKLVCENKIVKERGP